MSALKFGMDIIVFGLGVERVSPLQGSSLSIDVSPMILRRKVGRICPMQSFLRTNLTVYLSQAVGFIGQCRHECRRHDTFS